MCLVCVGVHPWHALTSVAVCVWSPQLSVPVAPAALSMEPAATRVTLDLASFEAPPAQLLRTQLSLHVRVSIVRSGLDVPVPTLGFRIVVSNWDNGMRGNYCDGKPTGPQDGGPGYGGGSSGRGGNGNGGNGGSGGGNGGGGGGHGGNGGSGGDGGWGFGDSNFGFDGDFFAHLSTANFPSPVLRAAPAPHTGLPAPTPSHTVSAVLARYDAAVDAAWQQAARARVPLQALASATQAVAFARFLLDARSEGGQGATATGTATGTGTGGTCDAPMRGRAGEASTSRRVSRVPVHTLRLAVVGAAQGLHDLHTAQVARDGDVAAATSSDGAATSHGAASPVLAWLQQLRAVPSLMLRLEGTSTPAWASALASHSRQAGRLSTLVSTAQQRASQRAKDLVDCASAHRVATDMCKRVCGDTGIAYPEDLHQWHTDHAQRIRDDVASLRTMATCLTGLKQACGSHRRLRVVMCGAGGAGKTSMANLILGKPLLPLHLASTSTAATPNAPNTPKPFAVEVVYSRRKAVQLLASPGGRCVHGSNSACSSEYAHLACPVCLCVQCCWRGAVAKSRSACAASRSVVLA